MDTLLISAAHVSEIVRRAGLDSIMDEMIDGLDAVCRDFDPAKWSIPTRSGLFYDTPAPGLLEWMPTRDASGPATIKIVGYHPRNPDREGLPTIVSSISKFDTRTGHLETLVDGTFATAVRTGAASAVATRALTPEDSHVLGLIGAGAQGIAQLHALSRVRPIDTVLLYDVSPETAASFERRAARLGLDPLRIKICESPSEVVRGAEILCTCTSIEPGKGPVFADEDLGQATHINAVGADFPGKYEIPLSILERSFICADFAEQCLAEGECQQISEAQIDTELIDLIQSPSRWAHARERLSIFDSTGWAMEDHIAASVLTEHAERLGIGTRIELEAFSRVDPKDPYEFLDADDSSSERGE